MQPVRRTRTLLPDASTALRQSIFQLVRVLAEAARAHADIHFVVELRIFNANGFCDLIELFECHSTAHLSSCSSMCVATHLSLQFAVRQDHRGASACADAASGHQADLAVFGCLTLRNAQAFLSRGHQLVGALDVAGRSRADRHGVLAGRLQTEVVVESDHSIGLAQRHAQRLCDKRIASSSR